MYKPTQEDLELLFQQGVNEKVKIELLDSNFKTIATLQNALISDSCSVDSDSDIRRTYEGNFYVKDPSFFIGESKKIWTDKYIRVWRGKKNDKTNQIVWYNMGIYLFNDTSYSYNETTKQLTISCVDMMSNLNNTFSGQITGAVTFEIPCEQTVSEIVEKTGNVVTCSNDGVSVAKTKVSIGSEFSFSLTPKQRCYWCGDELRRIELCIKGLEIYDKNGNVIDLDTTKLRLSIDDIVQTLKPSNDNYSEVFQIDKSKINKTISIGFLQNISFTEIRIRFYYDDKREIDNSIGVGSSLRWSFCDSKYYKSCLPIGTNISGNSSRKIIHNDEVNTLTIDTTKRAVNDTITKPTSWYSSITDTIKELGKVNDYIVEYTDETIPYDLEFSTGATTYDILKELVDLMVSWEMFFDVNGILHIQPTPTLYEDDILLSAEYVSPLVISETNKDSFSNVRNITEVWGMAIDASYYTDKCEVTNDGYIATFDDLVFTDEVRISNNTIIAIKINETNIKNPKLIVKGMYVDVTTESSEYKETEAMPIVTSSGDVLEENILQPNTSYCFKYYKGKFYYLGQFQVHGMCIETEKEPSIEEKELNKEKYNCENIYYSVEPNSPYCIEKIGERIQVLSGDDYENIYSDELAVERAKWENWKKTRRQETISLEMIDIPWLDVNCKIEYKSYIDGETHQYIVKSISSSTSEGTMSVELMRFYPLYILDAKQYEAVINLKEYMQYLIETYKYSPQNIKVLETLLTEGTTEIYATDNTEDIKTILTSYENKMNDVEKEN